MGVDVINGSPQFRELWTKREKENENQYLALHPDSLIPKFAKELAALGYTAETTAQLLRYMPRHKGAFLPIVKAYYQLAKQEGLHDEQNFFLQFFHYRGLDEVVPLLIEDYKDVDTADSTRWFISDCLYQICSPNFLTEYIDLVSNPQYGINRQMLVLLLGKLKSEYAVSTLLMLVDDGDVAIQAIMALGEYRRIEFQPCFERFLTSKKQGLRNAARVSLKKIKT